MPNQLLAAALLGICVSGMACAADRVTIRPDDSVGLLVVAGDVEDYTDEFITLRIGGGGLKTYPSGVVESVETYRTPPHISGIERYRRGEIPAAIADFEQALDREQRKWMRREVLARLVRCYQRQGNREAAAARFVEIVLQDPHTQYWNLAPLTWMAATVPDRLQAAARQWVVSPTEAVRLVGASILLGAPQSRLTGLAELNKLARSQDRYVGPLATVQVWYATLATNITSNEELSRWEHDIERMPASTRNGPWYAFGQVRLHRNEPDEAAAALLRVLIVHDEEELLAARAGLEAALALDRINRANEAQTVLREVVERFPWTPSAKEAAQHLTATQPPAAN